MSTELGVISLPAIEVDGISNGLTSILMMLGVEDVMYRTGVLRAEGEEKVLGIWKYTQTFPCF